MTSSDRPRLRALEAFPIEQDGERLIGLRDPSGFTDQVILLPVPALDIVSLFDGARSVTEIHQVVRSRHGADVPGPEEIARFAERLDEAGFLDSEGFAARRRGIEDAWLAGSSRPAAHAGGAYAGNPEALKSQIDGFFVHADGPGLPVPAAGAPRLRGLIAPHIDFHRGGPTYAWAYRALLERSDADLFVVLGTCHAGMADPFAVTLKAYDTPLGAADADRDFFDALSRRYGHDLLASEAAHRSEHSIEFQAVMLRRLVGRPFTILPVLASFLHEAVWSGDEAEADPRVPRFLGALGETIAASERRVCVIAGVDLAHVGPRFGDAAQNTVASLDRVAREDRRMLEAVTASEAAAFFASVAADGDSRRICGLSPIYAFLRALPGSRGELLRYAQWPDPQGAVTYCAAAFS
ncbi:MAG TPA: AmmeMemoRadiSam system protein B [Terriglobales bacterium]|nr:AmmeMemoRadiSam system protein B [Terriglobales bacterium]